MTKPAAPMLACLLLALSVAGCRTPSLYPIMARGETYAVKSQEWSIYGVGEEIVSGTTNDTMVQLDVVHPLGAYSALVGSNPGSEVPVEAQIIEAPPGSGQAPTLLVRNGWGIVRSWSGPYPVAVATTVGAGSRGTIFFIQSDGTTDRVFLYSGPPTWVQTWLVADEHEVVALKNNARFVMTDAATTDLPPADQLPSKSSDATAAGIYSYIEGMGLATGFLP